MATEIIKIIEREEDGYQVHVAKTSLGFSVSIFDTDAEEFLGTSKIYPNLTDALAYAEKC